VILILLTMALVASFIIMTASAGKDTGYESNDFK
jgi:hypothetical protein